jgi:N-acetylglucosaminyldiphosphoundecaprenol N-acetyl-beta-D-mannosaminyltransferase
MTMLTKPAGSIDVQGVKAGVEGERRAAGCAASGGGVRVEIAGVHVDNVSMAEAIVRIEELIRHRQPCYVVTPNADHAVRIHQDAAFRHAYRQAALVLADGMSLVWAARLLRTPLKEKVSGSDLFPIFAEVAARRGHRLFFLGGKPAAAQRSAEVLTQRWPGLQVVGVYCPPMGFERDPAENHKAIEMIRSTRPDVLFVGLGSPKQELWIHQHHRQYDVPVSVGIGGTFEFVSGMVPRAPRVMQKVGLEWFWRLAAEPRRMYRRYLIEDPGFFWLVWRQWRLRSRGGAARG